MATFAQQIHDSQIAHEAANALESSSQAAVAEAFSQFESGVLDKQTIRYRLEAIVRSAYRTSAALAYQHMLAQAELPNWKPAKVFNNEYLQSLLADVRRNLRDYKAGEPNSAATRRALLNTQLSASVAAERGFTDQMVSSASQLEDFGYQLRKVWAADYDDNEPCIHCDDLDGTVIGVEEAFEHPEGSGKVYIDLQGPPRHPRCRCRVILLIVSLDNASEKIDLRHPAHDAAPAMVSTSQIKKMATAVLTSVKAVLKSIISLGRNR